MGIDSLLNGLPELTKGQLSQNLPIVRIAVLLDREQPDSPRQNVTTAGLVGTYDGELYLTKSAFQSGDNLYHNGIQEFIYGRMPIANFYCVKNKATKDDETDDYKKYCELRKGFFFR